MIILGIDPGASGALAFLNLEAGLLDIVDMPVVVVQRGLKQKREISAPMIAAIIRARRPDVAWLERVNAMPGQGVSSVWAFARGIAYCGFMNPGAAG